MAIFNAQTNKQLLAPEKRILRSILCLSIALNIVLFWVMLEANYSGLVIISILLATVSLCLVSSFYLFYMLQSHFLSLANVIESLRIGDYSMRIVSQDKKSAWGSVFYEINTLASSYKDKRLQSVQSNILLDKLLAEFDIPVFIFNNNQILKNINQSACALFSTSREHLIERTASQLRIETLFAGQSGELIEHWFPNKGGKWELRKNVFIQDGERFTLLLINDLSQALREEERVAWQRLIRVLGHELNNSLASIISVSDSLARRLGEDAQSDWKTHHAKSLKVINERSLSLLRFTEAYTRLAKLPKPQKQKVDIKTICERVTTLLNDNVVYLSKQSVLMEIDPDQIEQMLINILKNAIEASDKKGTVNIKWQDFEQGLQISVSDEGNGLPSSDNLFVPFFTTKANGSGIGLFLCRQIAEAHKGTISLRNREDTRGSIAEVWLPK